jgi:AAA15 family ATPase/GTPase
VGSNGSGKTQLIKPLSFLSWFITRSFLGRDPKRAIPYIPHALKSNEKSTFELVFLLDGEEFKYKLSLTQGEILHESLHKKTSHLYSYVFVREKEGDNYRIKQQSFGFPSLRAPSIRGTASLIAAGHSYDVKLASRIVNYFSFISSNVMVTGRHHFHESSILESAKYFFNNPDLQYRMQTMVKSFDLGIESIEIEQTDTTDAQGNSEKTYIPVALHQTENNAFELPLFEESSGTQSAFVLLSRILPVLQYGGVAVIDEIDNDLHPHLLPHILDLFKHEHTNPNNAQIIFTCHTPEILNLLMKHQVYLVEKENQESEAWRLDEVTGLRADDNLYAKYMAGALSAVPNL